MCANNGWGNLPFVYIISEGMDGDSSTTLKGSGFLAGAFMKTDFLACTSALLFSRRFFNKVGKHLNKEMQFFPCQVICQGVKLDWYAVKILRLISFIDVESSGSYVLTNGDVMLDSVKYKRNITEHFYIARDSHEITRFVASELFVNECNANNILIDFEEVLYSC